MSLTADAVEVADLLCGPPAPLTPAQAAALAMEPMSDEACAEVGRILARIERRRTSAGQHGEAA